MKSYWTFKNRKVRFGAAIGAGAAMGQLIFRGASEYLGPVAGPLATLLATVVLVCGYGLIFAAIARSKPRAMHESWRCE